METNVAAIRGNYGFVVTQTFCGRNDRRARVGEGPRKARLWRERLGLFFAGRPVRIVGRVHVVDREGADPVDLDNRVTL